MATGGGGGGGEDGPPDEGQAAGPSQLTCAVCLEVYRRPKLLPCFHSFCQRCLQAVAGTAPSFPCPVCTAVVLLPQGGIPALQTNFYIEQDQDMCSTPPVRLCDVCCEDREATHSCLQCHQRYCSPCRIVHDSISSCRGHTVVPLQPDMPDGRGVKGSDGEERRQPQLCSRHRSQPVVLHCVPCRANICMQCKLTAHEGHSTEDLQDTGDKVKGRLRERLQALCQQVSAVQGVLSTVRDRRHALRALHISTEQGVRERAVRAKQLVDECQEHTLGSLQAVNQDLLDSLSATEQRLQHRQAALTAQTDHITRVLSEDKDTDLVDLEVSLSDLAVDQDPVMQTLSSLQTQSEPYLCEHNPLAIGSAQLTEFIGVLKKSDNKTARPKEEVKISGSKTVQIPAAVTLAASTTQTSGAMPTVQTQSVPGPGRQTSNIVKVVYSRNPKSQVTAICSTSENRVWVAYRPSGEGSLMALFDRQGKVRSIDGCSPKAIVTVQSDITIISDFQSHFKWTNVEGITGTSQNKNPKILSCAKTCNQFLYFTEGYYGTHQKLDVTSFHSAWKNFPINGMCCLGSLPLLADVSSCERYCVLRGGNTATLCSLRSGSMEKMSTYQPAPKQNILDACFFPVGDREMLVVLVEGDNRVHVVDHTDGCNFMGYLDTGHYTLHSPCLLATDHHSVLWVACHGGSLFSF